MTENTRISMARNIMEEFAGSTGLDPIDTHPRRYLWTDAFAVCNYLELFRSTKDPLQLDRALRLIDQVHHTLGKHRGDDARSGWISGLSEAEGELHPTIGGLRIGKQLNERGKLEPADDRREWDQDGQYYHYLTKWMHALNRVSTVSGNSLYLRWALELARTAHTAFTYVPSSGGPKRMYWKMSIDLTRPLVQSMGQHDPLDGFVTYTELQAAAHREFVHASDTDLSAAIMDLAMTCKGMSLVTDDPLGIGGLLFDGGRIAQLVAREDFPDIDLLEDVVGASLDGMQYFTSGRTMDLPARYRLAFRELGLAIGLEGVPILSASFNGHPERFAGIETLNTILEALRRYESIGKRIVQFWIERRNQNTDAWNAHRDINMVMLATSLAPEEFLAI